MPRILLACLIIFPLVLKSQTVGLIYKDDRSYGGYTLFGNSKTTYLIDNCGLVVNTWTSNYDPGVSRYLLPNGNLLSAGQLITALKVGGLGGIFELFDWEGNRIWNYEVANDTIQSHHDMAPLPNGNFLITAFDIRSEAEAKAKGRIYDGEVWSERILEIKILPDNQAEIVWQWALWDHLIQDQFPELPNYGVVSEYPDRLNINFIGEGQNTFGNWIHANAIDYNPELDQIAISSRLLSEIWIINHNLTTEEAKTDLGGFLYRYGNPSSYERGTSTDRVFYNQHDVHWIPKGLPNEGALMVFNNNDQPNASRIIMWQPPINVDGTYTLEPGLNYGPDEFVWTYENQGFFSAIVSGTQILPNGNIFICEGVPGHFFEITPEKELVWEYVNPVNTTGEVFSQGQIPDNNTTFRANRFFDDYPAFDGKQLIGTVPVELNPVESECYTIDDPDEEVPLSNWIEQEVNVWISQNKLQITAPYGTPQKAIVFSMDGKLLLAVDHSKSFDFCYPSGLYLIRIIDNNSEIQTYGAWNP